LVRNNVVAKGSFVGSFCYTPNMERAENHLNKAFIISSIYLLTIIFGGFFILPDIFRVDSYNFPLIVELFFKVTSAAASAVVLLSAVLIPGLKLIQKPKQRAGSPVVIATLTLLIGLIIIFLHGLYVKLMTCPVGGIDAWYCRVEGESYVGMLVLAFILASLVGCAAWIGQRLAKAIIKVL
jgi:hypothetical protein